MFNIEQMKKSRDQGIMLVPSEVDELINWAYARYQRKQQLNKEFGQLGKTEAYIENLAKTIYTNWPEADAHPWQAGGNSLKQDEARAAARNLLTGRTALNVGIGNGEADTKGSVPFAPLVAPAAPAVDAEYGQHVGRALRPLPPAAPFDFEARKLADLLSINRVYGKSGAAPKDHAHINAKPAQPNKFASHRAMTEAEHKAKRTIIAVLLDRTTQDHIEENAALLDCLLPRYTSDDSGLANGNNDGNYYSRADVLSLFDIAE